MLRKQFIQTRSYEQDQIDYPVAGSSREDDS
jgi:hypothetical protein